jgi:hypothetical protein
VSRLVAVVVVLVMVGAGGVAADERPYVSDVSPYVRDGRLVCDIRCGGLFSERIVGTIQSGLPAVVEAIYSLETADGRTVASGVHSFELIYDVWEDVYSVSAGDSTETFTGAAAFEQMSAAVERLHAVPIAPAGDLDATLAYTLSITIAVHPLTGTEERRVEGFLEESVGSHSHETWREQLLSINELISRFFSRHKGASNRSEVFRSASFAPGELPGSKLPVDGGGGGWTGEMTVAMKVGVR